MLICQEKYKDMKKKIKKTSVSGITKLIVNAAKQFFPHQIQASSVLYAIPIRKQQNFCSLSLIVLLQNLSSSLYDCNQRKKHALPGVGFQLYINHIMLKQLGNLPFAFTCYDQFKYFKYYPKFAL